jgi:hypothetical protein
MAEQPLRGYVRGLSMWPALIPGDILRARETPAGRVEPGQVTVLGRDRGSPVVHRVTAVREIPAAGIEVHTAGDRSGPDRPATLEPGTLVAVVTGVLIRGRYRKVAPKRPWASLAPGWMVKWHCAIARRIRWG